MRLEDSLLVLVVDLDGMALQQAGDVCRAAIGGGVDMIRLRGNAVTTGDRDAVMPVVAVCEEDDALLVLDDQPSLAAELGVAGVHLSQPDMSESVARVTVGMDRLVGLTTQTLDEARLSLELGVDYIVHVAGSACVAAFASLRGLASIPLYAGGIQSIEDASAIVNAGTVRLCVDGSSLNGDSIQEEMAAYSRLLGRSI